MELPHELQAALQQHIQTTSGRNLQAHAEELSARYRKGLTGTAYMTSKGHHQAYLATRMPATYAAVYAVLKELILRHPHLSIQTLLDVGAGPGTGLWAASELFTPLASATLVEQDAELLATAKRLWRESSPIAVQWRNASMGCQDELPHDLVLFSYSIGELPADEQKKVITKYWQSTQQVMAIIEPGTPAGFDRIRCLRDLLLQLGGHIVAPCPSILPCPMQNPDWCHFAARLPRTSEHRQAKNAALGHEDEKYSYLLFSKTPIALPAARILRHPQKRSGHMHLTLCCAGQVVNKTISKREGEVYRHMRKAEWGDSIPKI